MKLFYQNEKEEVVENRRFIGSVTANLLEQKRINGKKDAHTNTHNAHDSSQSIAFSTL